MGNIDFSQIKTKEQRVAEKLAQDKENAVNARKAQYNEQTDPALLEILLKKYKDDPDIVPIWTKRQEIQAANPYPEEVE